MGNIERGGSHRDGRSPHGGARRHIVAGLALAGLYRLIDPPRFFNPGWGHPRSRDPSIDHVVLIIVDTLRPDVQTCYRPGATPTPHIDRLAGGPPRRRFLPVDLLLRPPFPLRAPPAVSPEDAASEIVRSRYGAMETETVRIDPEIRQWLESPGYLR